MNLKSEKLKKAKNKTGHLSALREEGSGRRNLRNQIEEAGSENQGVSRNRGENLR